MNAFEYAAPSSLKEATALLSDVWGETEVLAGGTDLVTSLKQGITEPERVVSLKNLQDLTEIKRGKGKLRIGAMVTLAGLAKDKNVRKSFPSLITAIDGIGSSQMINVGTVGGDLCQRPRCWYFRNGYGLLAEENGKALASEGDNRFHAIFGNEGPAKFVCPSSLGPALIGLEASISVAGSKGKSRKIAAKDFFRIPHAEGERENALRPNEIVTEIVLPTGKDLQNGIYEVRHRSGLDWPYATAFVGYNLIGGKAINVRIVLGHVAPVPWSVPEAAKILEGNVISEGIAAKCGEAAAKGATPLSKNAYKVQLVKTVVKRAILSTAGMLKEVHHEHA